MHSSERIGTAASEFLQIVTDDELAVEMGPHRVEPDLVGDERLATRYKVRQHER
jgi:hypothetical protein